MIDNMVVDFKCSTCRFVQVSSVITAAVEHRFHVNYLFLSEKLNSECILMYLAFSYCCHYSNLLLFNKLALVNLRSFC